MKNKLKKITNSTLDELLGNEIILPSNYFQCFDKYAKTLNVPLDDNNFEKELNKVLLEDYNTINSYAKETLKSIDMAAELTQEARKAIKNKNESTLKSLYNQISVLKDELENITKEVYTDHLTKVYNKKWFYHKFLSSDATYKKDSTLVLVNICDYKYITEKYNRLIANNLLIFITKYLKKKLNEEFTDFDFIRYLDNKFVISINDSSDLTTINSFMKNMKIHLINTTLKSTSGVIIKPNFKYSINVAHKDTCFHDSLEILLGNLK